PRLRRRVRGRPSHRVPRPARRRGQAAAGGGRADDHVPRLLLPRAAQRRDRRATRARGGERQDRRDGAQRQAHFLLRRGRRAHVDGGARSANQRGAGARGGRDRRGHARGRLPLLHRDARRRRAQHGREDAGDRPRLAAPRGRGAEEVRGPELMATERARAIVIGGGITGASVAYHLAKAGWTDTLLLDKGELTSGSTCHAAGLVTQFNPSATMMRFRRYSIELYRELGVFETVGSLRFASSK